MFRDMWIGAAVGAPRLLDTIRLLATEMAISGSLQMLFVMAYPGGISKP